MSPLSCTLIQASHFRFFAWCGVPQERRPWAWHSFGAKRKRKGGVLAAVPPPPHNTPVAHTVAPHREDSPMKTGMNLLLWTTHVTQEHYSILGKLKEAGFDGVEIPIFEGDAKHYKEVRRELVRVGDRCTTVTVA